MAQWPYGVCERCGSEVVHKTKSQWMLAITKYRKGACRRSFGKVP